MSGPSTTKSRAERRRRITLAQLGAYALIVSTALFGFYQIDQTQEELCDNSSANRQAIRNVVEAIDGLGANLVLDGLPASSADPEEQAALETIHEFREEQLALLDDPVCTR